MHEMRDRVQTQFPLVLLTLISIIQALALELMWDKVVSSPYLYVFDINAVVAWGMLSVVIMGILQIWVTYSTLVIGFTWQPNLRDLILPFAVGIQEFMLVELIDAQFNVMWLYVLASLFIVMNWVAHTTFRRARADQRNARFFEGRGQAELKDFAGPFVIVLILVGVGVLSTALGQGGYVALTAIMFANAVLAYQIIRSRFLWHAMMRIDDV